MEAKQMHEEIAKIPASEFEFLQKDTVEEREAIAAPSLTFLQDSWRRLKKNKAAVFSITLLAIILVVSVGAIFFSPHNPAKKILTILTCHQKFLV